MSRQYRAGDLFIDETGRRQYRAGGLYLGETQGSDLSVTFDADGINSGWTDSDVDGAFFDDCNDTPDGSSADYAQSATSHGVGTTTSTLWLRLADVPADFDSLDSLQGRVDVQISGTPAGDTLSVTAQVFDSNAGGTENPLTNSQVIGTHADTARTQRTVTFGSLTGTKTQWNGAYAKLVASYTRAGGDDGYALRLFGASFTGTYTAAAAAPRPGARYLTTSAGVYGIAPAGASSSLVGAC